MTKELRVGVIIRAHGIKGEVKVYPTTDSPFRFDEITHVIIRPKRGAADDREVEGVKYFKGVVILKLKGIDDMNAAERLREAELYIPREEGAALGEGEYYIADILGMTVVTDTGRTLGVIRDVLETGANDVYVVERDASLYEGDTTGTGSGETDAAGGMADAAAAGAQPALPVGLPAGVRKKFGKPVNQDLLLPAIKQCILDTDIEKNVMTVHLLDGLLEL